MITIFKIKATGTKVWNALDADLETLSKKAFKARFNRRKFTFNNLLIDFKTC